MDNKYLIATPMNTSLAIDDAEMQRVLFSTDSPVGELPVFEPIGEPPSFVGVETQLPVSADPDIRVIEAMCMAGDSDCASAGIQKLLQAGTNPQDIQICLTRAAQAGRGDLVQMLLSVGVPVSLGAIKAAITKESFQLLSLFLKHGWNINEEEAWCIPPLLSFAIFANVSEALIAWFLSNGADPNATCQMDITPLSTAVAEGRYSVVEQLLTHCPPTTSFRGQLLHLAAGRNIPEDYDAIFRLVLQKCHQNDINAIMYQDHVFSYEVRRVVGLGTALHEAAKVGQLSAVRTLIASGADPSIRDSRGNTALEVAEREHNLNVADELRSFQSN
ncbi:uncharacterized protein RCC_05052 [Ramularia collo-cygni]|uniref:Uncharacterized protein n=1 Tax=Ramularia collo-cygni TaxID=112498 RepID=A0A2D3V6N3_9PEZI|nr:uncharacterized protein RCC_05052 [Ramularia collo-cygni]CZT19206.1 uncharacterized protein RCC_05052 [Ramularia collo-cygni]